jgi:pyruvate formate lyase activating enzyme
MTELNSNKASAKKTQGFVFEIERFAINDGPGIRTLVFLMGCPLHCLWCANPESQASGQKLMVWKNRCIGCRKCIEECPVSALSWDSGVVVNRSRCDLCGECTEVCNSNALTLVGKKMSAEDVFEQIDKDVDFYKKSGGGVTFSGGEPFAQPGFLLELGRKAKERGYHVCVETTGYVKWDVMREMLPYIDLFLYDFKHMDSETHRKFTGVGNELILDNYKRLLEYSQKTVIRFPVIPGINDTDENIRQLTEFLQKHNPCCQVDLLPYHALGVSKYERLDLSYQLRDVEPPSKERIAQLRLRFEENGFQVVVGG